MAQVLVRNLDDDIKAALQRRAGRHGRSTEEEIREILRDAVRTDHGPAVNLGSAIAERFRGCGLTDDIDELRGQPATAVDLGES
jgi:plasmid stability protein